jgi:hypothetical protein
MCTFFDKNMKKVIAILFLLSLCSCSAQKNPVLQESNIDNGLIQYELKGPVKNNFTRFDSIPKQQAFMVKTGYKNIKR